MNSLFKSLLTIETDSKYTSQQVQSFQGAKDHFFGYLLRLLETLCNAMEADRAFVALSGFEVGEFTPVAVLGDDSDWINHLSTSEPAFQRSDLRTLFSVGNGNSHLTFKNHSSDISQHINIVLSAHGELLGHLCLEKRNPALFASTAIASLREAYRFLAFLIAEQAFSVRVYQLADAFEFNGAVQTDLDSFYSEIVNRTALAFAADAVAMRIYNPENQKLEIVKSAGLIHDDLMVSRPLGEHVAGKLMKDTVHDWAALNDSESDTPTGMELSVQERQALLSSGVHACLIMRIGPAFGSDFEDVLGTLAYHIRRPHMFSWRDLALFRLYCQRVGNALLLDRQNRQLRRSREELELEHMILLQQSSQATHTDIISLLSHDLFHKSYHACYSLQEYTNRVEKALRIRHGDSSPISDAAEQAMDAALAIQTTLGRLRSMQQSATRDSIEESTSFSLSEILDEIETTLSGPLQRNKITLRRNIPSTAVIHGPRSLFSSIIFNLVINAIDAARTRTHTKSMSIYFSARVFSRDPQSNRVVIVVYDEGPGINRMVFRNPKDIFKIGLTTKPYGTGTGLPVARHLLQKHFNGDIDLLDSERAMFSITINTKAITDT
jgi:signal transduction histidine kinase